MRTNTTPEARFPATIGFRIPLPHSVDSLPQPTSGDLTFRSMVANRKDGAVVHHYGDSSPPRWYTSEGSGDKERDSQKTMPQYNDRQNNKQIKV